jgi:hypothetical protein
MALWYLQVCGLAWLDPLKNLELWLGARLASKRLPALTVAAGQTIRSIEDGLCKYQTMQIEMIRFAHSLKLSFT